VLLVQVRVWEIRRGFDSTERLGLGHAREVECSLFEVGRGTWLEGNMRGAVILLEALLVNSERHVRNLKEVKALLALAHLNGGYSDQALDLMDMRIGLAAQLVGENNMRPLSLVGSRFTVGDCLKREGAMVPDTVEPVWKTICAALTLNSILQELDLANCLMGSDGFTQLAPGLIANKSIHTLGLAQNELGVKSGITLQHLLRNNACLTHLDLSSNGLQDKGVTALAAGIAATLVYNTSLRCLRLRDNAITVHGALALSGALKMESLQLATLDVSLNPLGSEGVSHLVDPIFLGRPVVTFLANDCQIGMEGVVKVAEAVEASTSLCSLSLANTAKVVAGGQNLSNQVDGLGASLLAHALAQSYTLTRLDLSGCQIGVKGLEALGEVLKPVNYSRSAPQPSVDYMGILSQWDQRALFAARGTRGALRSLVLAACKLGTEGGEALKGILLKNPALVGLDLRESGIMGTGVAHIMIALGANPKYEAACNTTITCLNLQCCEAYAVGATHVADMLKHNNHLRRLNLIDNRIGPLGATLISESLKVNMSLQHFDLAKNDLGEDGSVALGEALGGNVSLASLDVSYNNVGDMGATALARGIDTNKSLTLLDMTENREMSALGAWYLSVAAKSKATGSFAHDRRLTYKGLPSDLQVRDQLPRILAYQDHKRVLSMKNVALDLARPPLPKST
jgi:Ran GTPase-activating protein (RanGAP) involved in mRNA processing and transport